MQENSSEIWQVLNESLILEHKGRDQLVRVAAHLSAKYSVAELKQNLSNFDQIVASIKALRDQENDKVTMLSINANKFLNNIEKEDVKYGEHMLPIVYNPENHDFDVIFV
jgi:hypothetical protein